MQSSLSIRFEGCFSFTEIVRKLFKKYCGVLLYFGSASHLYQRMPMGHNVSLPIWQTYINTILNCLESRKYCAAIMDDLLLFTPSKQSNMRKLEDL